MKKITISVKNTLANYRKINNIFNTMNIKFDCRYNDGLEYVVTVEDDVDVKKLISNEVAIVSIK